MSAGSDPRRRTAVVGDVGGHLEALVAELTRLGADPRTGRLPDDLRIVQVGDLVHRGPDSAGVVRLVDRYLTEHPGQWVQLVGNHEALYVYRRDFDWPQRLDSATVRTLRRWWSTGLMRVAATVTGPRGEYLVTHAGVTARFWHTVLRAPRSAQDAAGALDDLVGHGEADLFRPGRMLGGGAPVPAVGPVWTCATTELLPGWRDETMPFGQIHGHASVYDWGRERWSVEPAAADRTVLDPTRRHVTTTLAGGDLVGIDPGHGEHPAPRWRAWESDQV